MARSRTVLYEEGQEWSPWVTVLLWASVLVAAAPLLLAAFDADAPVEGGRSRAGAMALGLGLLLLPPLVRALVGHLVVRVTSTSVGVRLGRIGLFSATFPFSEVRRVEAVRYRPLREFGGWGYRRGWGRKTAWTLRGDGAVVLHRTDGWRTYLGSDHPERLRARIEAAGAGRFAAPEPAPTTAAGGGR